MCIILDTDAFSKFKNRDDQDMRPVRNWLDNKNGKIVYSNTDKLKKEWEKAGMKKWMSQQYRANKLKLVDRQEVQKKENELKGKIASNDMPNIALAMVAKVKVLVSGRDARVDKTGDKDFHKDFKNPELVGGKVYQQAKHSHLLTKNTCP